MKLASITVPFWANGMWMVRPSGVVVATPLSPSAIAMILALRVVCLAKPRRGASIAVDLGARQMIGGNLGGE